MATKEFSTIGMEDFDRIEAAETLEYDGELTDPDLEEIYAEENAGA